jgi:hypothetical protein
MNHVVRVRRAAATVSLSAWLLALCACTTIDDAGHGLHTRELLSSQHIDPGAAERNSGRAVPTDGRNVREAMQRQAESFKAPPQGGVGGVAN